jgi:microcystin-dependent protein
MSDNFLAEIRMFAGNFAPRGWALCNGQLMPISQNTALFSLVGTMYGGDGMTTFALPNLQGAAPMHAGQGPGLTARSVGESGGSALATLGTQQLPSHSHVPRGAALRGNRNSPQEAVWAQPGSGRTVERVYSGQPSVDMSPAALDATGGSQPHYNLPPYLPLTFIIALEGIFPPRE